MTERTPSTEAGQPEYHCNHCDSERGRYEKAALMAASRLMEASKSLTGWEHRASAVDGGTQEVLWAIDELQPLLKTLGFSK